MPLTTLSKFEQPLDVFDQLRGLVRQLQGLRLLAVQCETTQCDGSSSEATNSSLMYLRHDDQNGLLSSRTSRPGEAAATEKELHKINMWLKRKFTLKYFQVDFRLSAVVSLA